jgi:hypothetical protein
MKRVQILVLTLTLAAWAAPAAAGCIANGKQYATGTVLGSYQCQASGEWKRVAGR